MKKVFYQFAVCVALLAYIAISSAAFADRVEGAVTPKSITEITIEGNNMTKTVAVKQGKYTVYLRPGIYNVTVSGVISGEIASHTSQNIRSEGRPMLDQNITFTGIN